MKSEKSMKNLILPAFRKGCAALKHLSIKTQFLISMAFLLIFMTFLCVFTNRSIYKTYMANTDMYTTCLLYTSCLANQVNPQRILNHRKKLRTSEYLGKILEIIPLACKNTCKPHGSFKTFKSNK